MMTWNASFARGEPAVRPPPAGTGPAAATHAAAYRSSDSRSGRRRSHARTRATPKAVRPTSCSGSTAHLHQRRYIDTDVSVTIYHSPHGWRAAAPARQATDGPVT